MGVGGINQNRSTQSTYGPQRTETSPTAPSTTAAKAEGGISKAAEGLVKSDLFKGVKQNVFDAIKSALPGLKDVGKKLLDNPEIKKALGNADPSKLIDQAKGEAKKLLDGQLAKLESWKPPSKEVSADKGKNLPDGQSAKDFVAKGLGQNSDWGIKPTKTGTKDVTLNDSQKAAADKAFGGLSKAQDAFAKGEKLQDLAKKVGIDTTLYKKEGEVGVTKNLHTSADGKGTVDMHAKANGSVKADLTGVEAKGHAEVGVTATRSDSVKTEGKYGTADASYTATAKAGASADGSVKLDKDGLKANANLEVGVSAKVEGQAKVESKPIGGVPGLTAYAGVKGEVEVGAKAYAKGEAKITGNPPQAVVSGQAGAFAGARASVEGQAGVGPVGVKGRAEGWAGVGAEAHFEAGLKDGKLKLSFGAGAALGYGGKLSGGVEIDLNKAKQIGTHLIDKGGEALKKGLDANKDGKIDLKDAAKIADNVADGAKKVGDTIADGAKTAAKTVVNTAGKALDAVGSGLSKAGDAVSGFAKKLKFW